MYSTGVWVEGMKILAIIATTFIFCSCGNEKPIQPVMAFEQIKVGMTYDEVEKLLGKPAAISRGISQLEATDPDHLLDTQLMRVLPTIENPYGDSQTNSRYNELKAQLLIDEENLRIIKEETHTYDFLRSGDRRYWPIVPTISETGTLLYVAWIYEKDESDTLYTTLPIYTEIPATIYVNRYFVNGMNVTKDEYDLVASDTVYYSGSKAATSLLVSKETWIELNRIGRHWTDPPLKPMKLESKYMRPEPRQGARRVQQFVQQTAYLVDIAPCVVFDASSGRVVFTNHRPLSISAI